MQQHREHDWDLGGQYVHGPYQGWLEVLYHTAPRQVGLGLRLVHRHREVHPVVYAERVGELGFPKTHRLTHGTMGLGHTQGPHGPEECVVEVFGAEPHEYEIAVRMAGAGDSDDPVLVVGLRIHWARMDEALLAQAEKVHLVHAPMPALVLAGPLPGIVSGCRRCRLSRRPDPTQPRTGTECEGVRWQYTHNFGQMVTMPHAWQLADPGCLYYTANPMPEVQP